MSNQIIPCALVGTILAAFSACAPNQTPDQVRERTAEATATLKRDTKAVAEGIKDGLSENDKKSVDLNNASRDELSALPGITKQTAVQIIAERPYATPRQLMTRHVVSEGEYAQIRHRVTVTR